MSQINDFSKISGTYSVQSIVQQSASDFLISNLKILDTDSILDVGCGTGKITARLSQLTNEEVTGIDPSAGMIESAIRENQDKKLRFIKMKAEDISFREQFDIIFCNSAMQWFQDPGKFFFNFYNALKSAGRFGVQAPAKNNYCPNFIKAITKIREEEETSKYFSHFSNPWFFFDTDQEYMKLVEYQGFTIQFCKIVTIKSKHTPEEVLQIFNSGAAAGYLNQSYYQTKIDNEYLKAFRRILFKEFELQKNHQGLVELVFNRIYILAGK